MEPRVKLYVPTEESFPIPLEYIDVTRATDTFWDLMSEKNIDDHWNVDGNRELSDACAGFTRFIVPNEKSSDGYTWSGEKLTRKQTTQMCGSMCLMHRNSKNSKNGPSRNPNSIMPEDYVIFSWFNLMMKNSSVL